MLGDFAVMTLLYTFKASRLDSLSSPCEYADCAAAASHRVSRYNRNTSRPEAPAWTLCEPHMATVMVGQMAAEALEGVHPLIPASTLALARRDPSYLRKTRDEAFAGLPGLL